MDNILHVEQLRVYHKDATGAEFCALDVERLTFSPGALHAITGPSGSGKSTFLMALSGLARQISGRVMWNGEEIFQRSPNAQRHWRRKTLGLIFQDFQLIGELSAFENIVLPARFTHYILPTHIVERANMLLSTLNIPKNRVQAQHLSRGEAQRVAIARALLLDPPILVADEPTASLDPTTGMQVLHILREFANHGKIILLATHDQAAIEVCSTHLALRHGKQIEKIL